MMRFFPRPLLQSVFCSGAGLSVPFFAWKMHVLAVPVNQRCCLSCRRLSCLFPQEKSSWQFVTSDFFYRWNTANGLLHFPGISFSLSTVAGWPREKRSWRTWNWHVHLEIVLRDSCKIALQLPPLRECHLIETAAFWPEWWIWTLVHLAHCLWYIVCSRCAHTSPYS